MEKVRYDILGEVQWSTLDALKNIQGELKTLEDGQYKKLRSQIIQNGFSYVVHVWRNDGGELCVLDGNQRIEALRRMQAEGVDVGMVPVLEVAAESEKEAFKKLLGGASVFGTFHKDALANLSALSNISLDEIMQLAELPDFRMSKPKLVSFETKEISLNEFSSFNHKCPKCGFEFDGA